MFFSGLKKHHWVFVECRLIGLTALDTHEHGDASIICYNYSSVDYAFHANSNDRSVLGFRDRTVLFSWGQFCLPKEAFWNILVATSKGGGC